MGTLYEDTHTNTHTHTHTHTYIHTYVSLAITLANDQLDTKIVNTFITVLYMYMFRAISCSSLGGQIVLTQHLVHVHVHVHVKHYNKCI
jgi:hypothetical protein